MVLLNNIINMGRAEMTRNLVNQQKKYQQSSKNPPTPALPRQGRHLGPPQVRNLFLSACHYPAVRQLRKSPRSQPHLLCAHRVGTSFCQAPSLPNPRRPFAMLQTPKTPKRLRGSFVQLLKPQPSLFTGLQGRP